MSEEAASEGLLSSFKEKAQNWAKDVVRLYNTPVPPSMVEEKKDLMARAGTIKKAVEGIFGTISDLQNVGLGFLPLLIPAAVVLGASAAIYKWYTDFSKFQEKLKYHQQLTRNGESNASAAKIVESITGNGATVSTSKLALFVGGGIALYLFLKNRG